MRELENIFNIVDEDGDGWIEPEELQPFALAPTQLRAPKAPTKART